MKPAGPRAVHFFELVSGRYPAMDDLMALRDKMVRSRLVKRIERAAQGNYGLHRRLDADFVELIADFGPGYRIYMGEDGAELIVMLAVGDKSSQASDIHEAQAYWQEYKRRKRERKHL